MQELPTSEFFSDSLKKLQNKFKTRHKDNSINMIFLIQYKFRMGYNKTPRGANEWKITQNP